MGRRVVQFDKKGKAVAVYENITEAAKATGFDASNIGKNLLHIGNKYVKGYRFEWEVTNKELREARKKDRAERLAQKIKDLEKEFHINDQN